MNHIEKGWIDNAKAVGTYKTYIRVTKETRMINRIDKKAYELALVEHKKAMNEAMRAGNFAEVSRNHKVINILRENLQRKVASIAYDTKRIKEMVEKMKATEVQRDQFERAYRLVEAADALAMANAEIMNDVPVVPMQDGDMEQIVRDLGY